MELVWWCWRNVQSSCVTECSESANIKEGFKGSFHNFLMNRLFTWNWSWMYSFSLSYSLLSTRLLPERKWNKVKSSLQVVFNKPDDFYRIFHFFCFVSVKFPVLLVWQETVGCQHSEFQISAFLSIWWFGEQIFLFCPRTERWLRPGYTRLWEDSQPCLKGSSCSQIISFRKLDCFVWMCSFTKQTIILPIIIREVGCYS